MLKKEWIYRELAVAHLRDKGVKFTELALSEKFGISLSTVHHALAPLKDCGMVVPLARGWRLVKFSQLLSFWGSARRLVREIIWQGNAEGVSEAEKLAPSGAVWGGFTAYKLRYGEAPTDYSALILYAGEKQLEEIRKRMEAKKGQTKLVVLKKDPFMEKYAADSLCPDPQIYADLWNLKEWYAADFRRALERRMRIDETVLE